MTRLSEDQLIATLFAPLAAPGGFELRDDAALLVPPPGQDLVLTKDMLVAGVHFFPGDPAEAIARKALRVNLSDLAAKGATPVGFLLGLGIPADWTAEWLEAFTRGLASDAADFGCPLYGGDTVKAPEALTLSVSMFGRVPSGRMVPRMGAKAGDVIYVSGTIGDAALGLRLRLQDRLDAPWIAVLEKDAGEHLRDRYLLPRPRLGLQTALQSAASAAMDVSDGLAGDLGKMLALEGLTADISIADVPLSAAARSAIALHPALIETVLTGGDDYEILCTVPPARVEAFEKAAAAAAIPIARLGVARQGEAPPCFNNGDGLPLALSERRYSHF